MATKQVVTENEEEAIGAQNELALHLDDGLKEEEFVKLKNLFIGCPFTSRQHENIKTMADLFQQLENDKKISVGNYKFFAVKLEKIHPRLATEVQEMEKQIQDILNGGNPSVMDVPAASTSPAQEIHADLLPLIKETKDMIKEEIEKKKKKFLETKAFLDAKDKLQKNRVLVIKGNTGDGKTSTAIQLLHWLIEEQQCREPRQLFDIKDFELMTSNSNLVTFIDDIFGEEDVGRNDVQEWNKRLKHVQRLFVGEQIQANFLLITIRNEIFNALGKSSLGEIFIPDYIIDLSSGEYRIADEKRELLERYRPGNFSWTEQEIENILSYAPYIGFPKCCELFCESNDHELQKTRSDFFMKPVKFLKEAFSRLPECSAILFLFLNGGEIKVKDLDPNGDKVNKTLLEEAFDINLVDCEVDRTSMTFKKKVGFVKESFERLLGFLVRKEKHRLSGDEMYRFDHSSIYFTVALLYGDKTPVGYIQNCPRNFLRYITTSKTFENMVVISSDDYTDMCKRLLQEFQCEVPEVIPFNDIKDSSTWIDNFVKRYDFEKISISIGSLDVWKDPVFLEEFFELLNEREVNKLEVLNKACYFCAEECALYLLRKGVQPDKDTRWWSLITRGGHGKGDAHVLMKVVKYLNDEIKLNLLNEACRFSSEECVLCLLCEVDKPDKNILLDVVKGGSVILFYKLQNYDVSLTVRDNDNNNFLHVACQYNRVEMVSMLCEKYPDLVHDTNHAGQTPLYLAAGKGNCSIFKLVERTVLNSLYRDEDEQHKCKTEDVVHRSCACSKYMSQLVNNYGWEIDDNRVDKYGWEIDDNRVDKYGWGKDDYRVPIRDPHIPLYGNGKAWTILHESCAGGSKKLLVYLCEKYPALTTVVDSYGRTVLHVSCMFEHREMCVYLCESVPQLIRELDNKGRHCLHYIAMYTSDVDLFTECETRVKQYMESLKLKYDIRTIWTWEGRSVLDLAKEMTEKRERELKKQTLESGDHYEYNNPLYDHLDNVFSE
ncbi:uncharacterized protein LOC117327114 [Pecten maximus]|uniref:uncharacterized protein LOC117327114 n=1 Tax=Pecten maximus TaxID=6579 RepID=UPI0014584A06|nr:uncharacterized protein LOC117327114 [Pecten maximus]